MRIVYLLDVFPKLSETFVLNEILEVKNNGLDVYVCALHKPKDAIRHKGSDGIKDVIYLSGRGGIRKIADHVRAVARYPLGYLRLVSKALNPKHELWECFRFHMHEALQVIEQKPDLIHVHFCAKASNLALMIHLLSGISFSFTTHRYDIYDLKHRNLTYKSSKAKKHITISESNKKYLINECGVSRSDIKVVHCGIDINKILPMNETMRENIILNVGRLDAVKAHDKLIETTAFLRKEKVHVKTIIIGEGKERGNLEHNIKKYQLGDSCELLGGQTQDVVFGYYKKAKMFVLTSRTEGIPVSLMEAMVFKVPVIASNVGGVSELVEHGKNGYLYPFGDIETLVGYIKELLSDNVLRQKFTNAAYKKVIDGFNLAVETKKLIEIWKN